MVCWWIGCERVGEVTTLGCGGISAAHEAILCVCENRFLDHAHTGEHSVCYWETDTGGGAVLTQGSKGLLAGLLDYL